MCRIVRASPDFCTKNGLVLSAIDPNRCPGKGSKSATESSCPLFVWIDKHLTRRQRDKVSNIHVKGVSHEPEPNCCSGHR